MKTVNQRTTKYNINDLFLQRHSPRAMSGEKISQEELLTLFEAARWAPSSLNLQPWRFIYAQRETPEFDRLFSFLMEFNQAWCKNAAALVVVVSQASSEENGKVHHSRSHSLDTGAAWENLALQGSTMGLVVHGMGAFDAEKAQKELDVPENFTVEMMIAIGKPGKVADLPAMLQEREVPSQREELSEIVFHGKFK